MEIKVLSFGSDDYKASLALRYKVLREPLGLVYTPEQLADEKEEIHIAAFENGVIIGVILMRVINKNLLKMRQVAVDASRQRKGVGKLMVDFAENWGKERGYSKIELHARIEAVPFYLALGYSKIGDEFVEVGIRHYKMEKEI